MAQAICTLYLVRHGESETNRDGIISGHFDSPLTDKGREQAKATKAALAAVHFDEVYSSDLQRAVETAEIIFGKPVPAAHRLAGLRERTFGKLEGRPKADFMALITLMPKTLSARKRWKYKSAADIESNDELCSRFLASLKQVAQANMGKTVLVGTHGGCIRVSLIQLGFASELKLPPGSFQNGGYSILAFDGQEFTVEKVEGVKTSHFIRHLLK